MAKSSRYRHKLALLLFVLATALLSYAGYGIWREYTATHGQAGLDASQTITTSTAEPDETPLDRQTKYKVADDEPRRITLPTIGASGFIQKVGIDQNGAVAVPNNIHAAGWFINESKPGRSGVSLIDGHVQGKYEPGIFKNLNKLNPGDKFEVEYGDKSVMKFAVVSVKSYAADKVGAQLLQPDPAIKAQLNLVTCGGSFNRVTQQYDERLLVVSKQIDG